MKKNYADTYKFNDVCRGFRIRFKNIHYMPNTICKTYNFVEKNSFDFIPAYN